jgi:phosphoenolpyruvate carboxykinase (ATP)
MDFDAELDLLLNNHVDVQRQLSRKETILQVVSFKEAMVTANGSLATWTPCDSTGRSPQDTRIVKRPEIEDDIDWDSPNNLALDAETFSMLWSDAIDVLGRKKRIFVTNRSVGADERYAMPVETITDSPLTALFTLNMFRPLPNHLEKSLFWKRPFRLLVLPQDKINATKYTGRLRRLSSGKTSNLIIAMDFANRLGLVFGSSYLGSVKKLMFTVMNYYLPLENILPLHCSANEDEKGRVALFLGLSGTGKTTLSADPNRALLGDDEHGWSQWGVANFEFGCYAKLVDLDPKKEPEIYNAVFHRDEYTKHGAIVENAMMYPNGEFDLTDERLTPNSRASYPLSFVYNSKLSSIGAHPDTIIFLTADAHGVLPPVATLSPQQAMLWFLMGYTSKLGGTETGIVEPVSTFSRFFGQPFMPCLPDKYAYLLGEKMKRYGTRVYLINTGWSGGPFGIGQRMDIDITRAIVNAALEGDLTSVQHRYDPLFHLDIPTFCSKVPPHLLNPSTNWNDKKAFEKRAEKLAGEFREHFIKTYEHKGLDPDIRSQCPGIVD